MKSKKMKMSISKIYKHYGVPLNLQNHMLRATAMAKLLCENWTGPLINQENIITTMLIHDVGNIAKMDFNNHDTLLEENKDIVYWQNIKQEFIRKYGTDDHIATFNIASELGLGSRILWLAINKIFVHNEMIAASNDCELKICAYSDQRTDPYGIVSLKDRFDELKRRHSDKPEASINHPRSKYLIESAYEIERQILRYTALESSEIVNKKISELMHNLSEYKIKTTYKIGSINRNV